jgi:hypothetical protein
MTAIHVMPSSRIFQAWFVYKKKPKKKIARTYLNPMNKNHTIPSGDAGVQNMFICMHKLLGKPMFEDFLFRI